MIITTVGIKNKETGLIEYFPIYGGGEGSINNFIFSNEKELSIWLEKPSNKNLLTDGSLLDWLTERVTKLELQLTDVISNHFSVTFDRFN